MIARLGNHRLGDAIHVHVLDDQNMYPGVYQYSSRGLVVLTQARTNNNLVTVSHTLLAIDLDLFFLIVFSLLK